MKQSFLNMLMYFDIYYPSGCDVAVPDHECDPCEVIEHARVRSVAFVKKDFVFIDPTSPTEWRAGILAKDIIIIPEVLGSYNGGDPQEGTGYGDQASRFTGYQNELNFKDPNYGNNAPFYNALKYSREYKLAWRTETKTHISDNPVSILPKNPVTETLTDEVVYDVTARWNSSDMSEPFDTPVGIFDRCFDYV
jgi:hypothetical protein